MLQVRQSRCGFLQSFCSVLKAEVFGWGDLPLPVALLQLVEAQMHFVTIGHRITSHARNLSDA